MSRSGGAELGPGVVVYRQTVPNYFEFILLQIGCKVISQMKILTLTPPGCIYLLMDVALTIFPFCSLFCSSVIVILGLL